MQALDHGTFQQQHQIFSYFPLKKLCLLKGDLKFLFSCSSENKLHLSNVELLEVIMTEHDDLMLEMKTIKEIKNNLLELDEIEEDLIRH